MHQVMISNAPAVHAEVIKPNMINGRVLKQLNLKQQLSNWRWSSSYGKRGEEGRLTSKEGKWSKRPIEKNTKKNKLFAEDFGPVVSLKAPLKHCHEGCFRAVVIFFSVLNKEWFNYSDKMNLYSTFCTLKCNEPFRWRDRLTGLMLHSWWSAEQLIHKLLLLIFLSGWHHDMPIVFYFIKNTVI